MTRAEAKRRVCAAFATHMDNSSENAWLAQGADGAELSSEDARRMQEAFDELVRELRRRGGAVVSIPLQSAARVVRDWL